MFRRNVWSTGRCRFEKRYAHKCTNTPNVIPESSNIAKIRNIGILAHIDAGKTTTTERMLYYSGLIKHMGEVHQGNTVTDYMEQERERGITITSAAVTFDWKSYRLNLIDTPGHIDFTMEVEQTLRVLDGAIVVLDGSAGVEAQTLTVCKQADRYQIPRIIYINKMDRHDADFQMSLRSIETKLNVETLPTQFPIKIKGRLESIVDVISMNRLIFDKKTEGRTFTREPLEKEKDGKFWEMAYEQRKLITDKLSGLDDKLAEIVIEEESLEKISANAIMESLRRVSIARKGVPVLLGSSYKNIGVQLLMDAVILYLPSPQYNMYANQYKCFGNDLSARAFKVVHDKQKGPLSFLRIYTGQIKKGARIYSVSQDNVEQCGRLYTVFADEYKEINEVAAGNIAAVTGLNSIVTGDLVTTSASALGRARREMEKIGFSNGENVENIFTIGNNVPDPVFFCSIEAPSLSQQAALEGALQELVREDPSLRVTQNTETGQTELAGMGELHLEIIKQRIRTEYKIDVDIGPLQIAYKETIENGVKDTYAVQHKIGTSNHSITVTMSLIPEYKKKEVLLFDTSQESASNIAAIHPKVMAAIKSGVKNALSHGPKLSCPVVNVGVKLHWLEIGRGTSGNIIIASIAQCIKKLLRAGGAKLLEPIMHLEVITTDEHSAKILADLSRRRAEIQKIDIHGQNKVFVTLTPLSELLGFATALRILSSGTATFSLEFSHYQSMNPQGEEEAIRRVTGI